MDLYVKERHGYTVGIIDQYKSLIWTKRYREAGEFELYMPMSMEMFELLKPYRLIKRKDDDTVMMIETIRITTDEEDGDHLIVSGRSLEAALDESIFAWAYEGAPVTGTIFNILKTIYKDRSYRSQFGGNFWISEEDYPAGSPIIMGSHTFSEATKGMNCYDAVKSLCQTFNIGYKVVEYPTDEAFHQLILYEGHDLAEGAYSFPVIFSQEYDNLNSSEYVYDVSTYADAAFVIGGDIMISSNTKFSGHQQITPDDPPLRRYIFVDATDATTNTESVTTKESYNTTLQAIAKTEIAKQPVIETFEADLDMTHTFIYRKHFWVGSVVTIKNEYGIRMDARIIEVNEIDDENGYSLKPVLERVR